MKSLKTIKEILVICIIVFLVWFGWKEYNKPAEQIETITTDTLIEYKDSIVYLGGQDSIIYQDRIQYKYIDKDLNLKLYNDLVITDRLKIFIADTIKGDLISRKINYILKPFEVVEKEIIKTITKNITVHEPIKGYLIGSQIMYNYKDSRMVLGVNIIRYSGKYGYSLGYNFDSSLNFGFYYRF